MKTIDIVALIILNILWGTVYTVAGYSINFFPPIFLYSMRFLIAGIFLLPFCKTPKTAWKETILFGVLQSLTFLGICIALKHIDSSISAIIMRLDIPIIILIANVMFKEKININLIVGILMCFFAVYIIAGGMKNENSIFYLIIVLISAVLSALSHIVSKIVGDKNVSNESVNCYSSFIIFFILIIFSIIFKENSLESIKNADTKAWILLLYLGLVPSLVGYQCLHFIMRRNPTVKTMPVSFSRPIINMISAYIVLDEALNKEKIIGLIIITLGIILSEKKFNNKQQ